MNTEKSYFLDKPENVKKILYGLYTCCGLLLVLDVVINRHIYHPWENLWGFYPLYGFVGCVVLVLVAKWLRKILMRDEHYYDRFEQAAEDDKRQQNGGSHHGDNHGRH
ncbi:MAG: hypothetical protein AB7U63_00190 [Porticoccaceae bacterium]